MNKKIEGIYAIFFFIIIVWCLISFVRLVYNGVKLFTEEKAWIGLNEEERRVKAYGNIEQVYKTVNTRTKNTDCLLLDSGSPSSYFLLRYLLYPKHVYFLQKGYSTTFKKGNSCTNLRL